jgi:hypothetical protein
VPIADGRQTGLDEVVAAFTRAGVHLHPRQEKTNGIVYLVIVYTTLFTAYTTCDGHTVI